MLLLGVTFTVVVDVVVVVDIVDVEVMVSTNVKG